MMGTKSLLAGALGIVGLAVTGCSGSGTVTTSPPPVVVVEATGQLTITWTVAGEASSDVCFDFGADATELTVWDSSGRMTADEFANCEDFAITLELPVDTYQGDLLLVDVNDDPVSTTLPLDDLRITPDSELVVDVDFPVSSIL